MLSLLRDIWCVVTNLGRVILWAIAQAIEYLLLMPLGALLAAAVSVLPPMPPAPQLDSAIMESIRWVLPLDVWLATLAWCAAVLITITGARAVLRWFRAMD